MCVGVCVIKLFEKILPFAYFEVYSNIIFLHGQSLSIQRIVNAFIKVLLLSLKHLKSMLYIYIYRLQVRKNKVIWLAQTNQIFAKTYDVTLFTKIIISLTFYSSKSKINNTNYPTLSCFIY